MTSLRATVKYVNRPKSASVKDIDIDICIDIGAAKAISTHLYLEPLFPISAWLR